MSYTDSCYSGLGASDKRIVFLSDKLACISGQTVNEQILLKDFFIPVTNCFTGQFSIAENTSGGAAPSVELSYGNISTAGQVNAIFVFTTYDSNVDDADKYIEWSWDEVTWYPLGKILALSSANNEMLDAIYLRNPSETYPVNITVMIGN